MKNNAIVAYDKYGYEACMSKVLKNMGFMRIFDALGDKHWINIPLTLPKEPEWADDHEILYPDVNHIGDNPVMVDTA